MPFLSALYIDRKMLPRKRYVLLPSADGGGFHLELIKLILFFAAQKLTNAVKSFSIS